HQVTNQVTDEIPIIPTTASVNAINMAPTKQSSANTEATLSSPADVRSTLTPTPAVDVPRVTLIGDSIMQGATPMIEDVLGPDIYVDAARKRRMEDVPALIESLYAKGHLS